MTQSLANSPPLFGDLSVDHAIAGFGAGIVSTGIMHPLDLVKVRFQLAGSTPTTASTLNPSTVPQAGPSRLVPAPQPSVAPSPNSFSSRFGLRQNQPRIGTAVYKALEEAVKQDGWKGLYRGLIPNLVGGASSWGLYFLFYNMIKKNMQGGDPNYRTSSGQHLIAAAEASAITAMLTNPIWVVKTRVFATGRSDPAYRGLWTALRTIYTKEGIRGLYKGSLLALVGVSNGSIQFATYEGIKRRSTDLKRRMYEKKGKEWRVEDEKLSNTEYILASGWSKLVAIALTYPYQVVRARIQNFTPTTATPKLSMLSVIASTYRNEGLLAFYKGLGTNALRILPGTCTTFVVYENLVWGFRSVALRRQARERAESDDALR